MDIRQILKNREEAREAAQNNKGGATDLPENVSRYVGMGQYREVGKEGKSFVVLADPNDFFYYWCHESKMFDGRKTIHDFRKHTCLWSPKDKGADLADYFKPNGDVCPTCKAKGKRKLFAIIPVFDIEHGTWRVLDTVEYHFNNLISDYDKIEKAARKFNKSYSLVGDVVTIRQVDKTFTLESAEIEDESVLEAAAKFIGIDYGYSDLAFFREYDDIVGILNEATGGVDISKLDKPQGAPPAPKEDDVRDEM